VYGNIIPEITCGQASSAKTDFPVFVGEWSLEAIYNNTLDGRAALYQSQQYAYSEYLSGGAFWGYKSVVGEWNESVHLSPSRHADWVVWVQIRLPRSMERVPR
jgi:hypothetical protein